jgi:two-component system, chemotaxis family, chemotaxis protein CheY
MIPAEARLLLVDDMASMRAVLRRVLNELGFTRLDEAADGVAALELFRVSQYDLVITDWYMPHATGLQLLRSIRCGQERNQTPVLLMTGYVTTARVTEAIEAGANGFIAKPFVDETLTSKVSSLLHLPAPRRRVPVHEWPLEEASR